MTILDPRVLLVILLLVIASYGTGRLQQHRSDTKTYQAERTAAALDSARVQIKAVDEARIEEQRRAQEISEVANEATHQIAIARADARAADAAAERLRARVDQLAAAGRAAGYSTASLASPSQPSGDPTMCSSTCSAGLTALRESLANMPTTSKRQALPASERTMP